VKSAITKRVFWYVNRNTRRLVPYLPGNNTYISSNLADQCAWKTNDYLSQFKLYY